jgi:hypothetical protein
MNTKVKELSLEELKSFIDETVDMKLQERFGDPDIGLEVKPEVIEKIRKSRKKKQNISAGELAKKLGLNW